MKLDKIKFAEVYSEVTRCGYNGSVQHLDDLLDVEVTKVACEDINELLYQVIKSDGFILAIKAYRKLTGVGLKEAKEAIERYRIIPNFPQKNSIPDGELKVDPKEATLGDILYSAGRIKAGNNIG